MSVDIECISELTYCRCSKCIDADSITNSELTKSTFTLIDNFKLITSNQVMGNIAGKRSNASSCIIYCRSYSYRCTNIESERVDCNFRIRCCSCKCNSLIIKNLSDSIVFADSCTNTSDLNNITNVAGNSCHSKSNFTTNALKIKSKSSSTSSCSISCTSVHHLNSGNVTTID